MSRNLFLSFFFFSFATLCALQLQILLRPDAAAVQPEVQPARRTVPCTKKTKKTFRVLAPRRSLTGPSASHPIHQSRCSIPPPPHLCFLAAVTHPGLALPRQPPPASLPPSPPLDRPGGSSWRTAGCEKSSPRQKALRTQV